MTLLKRTKHSINVMFCWVSFSSLTPLACLKIFPKKFSLRQTLGLNGWSEQLQMLFMGCARQLQTRVTVLVCPPDSMEIWLGASYNVNSTNQSKRGLTCMRLYTLERETLEETLKSGRKGQTYRSLSSKWDWHVGRNILQQVTLSWRMGSKGQRCIP